ncbi:ABC transporter ATP-binding protein [Pseudonocardia phyllosphaerae]|uniref:ABC transporter ATP-binding protein n=1 Tax=Pseudonocardia phyllosphaerae TaxID=3390502 RepID=UPI00397C48D9
MAPAPPALAARDLACGYGSRTVLSGITVGVAPGEVVALLGRNGVGKTTLFKTLLGLLPARNGTVEVGGEPLAALSRRERARRLAYVPQGGDDPFAHRVLDVVLLGRTASLGWRPVPGARDAEIARSCLDRLGIAHLADRSVSELSGGQRQMVLIARALAQEPGVLMMDEPTADLDLGNEVRVLTCIRDLAAEGVSVVFTSHRPEHAFRVASRAVLLQPDGSYAAGPVAEVLTGEAMSSAYGAQVVVTAPEGGLVSCTALLPDQVPLPDQFPVRD